MAILQKTREKAGLAISIIIALALLSFILDPGTLETAFQAMSSKNDVGNINGHTVSYADFQEEVSRIQSINEVMTGSSAQSEQQQEQIRNAAWQGLIDKYLFLEKASEAGIKVGADEMRDLLSGDMVSPVISQNPAFLDENGMFSREAVQNLVSNISQDQSGTLSNYWNYLKETVYTQQFYAKYGSLFLQGDFQNPLMLKRAIAENNSTTNIDFVMVPSTYLPDSTIQVSDSEIQKYYNDHKKLFKQNASRDIEYVVFEVKPSESDINATSEAIREVYDDFCTTENLKSFLARNSEVSLDNKWYKAGELKTVNSQIDEFVSSNTEGTSPIVSDNDNVFYAARIVESAQIPDSVFVRHILLQGSSESKADSILTALAKGESFSNAAASNSADTQSAAEGELGNIGWMTQNYMIPGFESVLTAPVRQPYVIKTQYGTHIVEVTRRTAPVLKKQVAILQKTSVASNETYNTYYNRAARFENIAKGKFENYRAAVDSLGVYSHPMNNVLESTANYGAIDHAKEVTRWVYDNKVGKVSDIITVNNNYFFIVALKGIHKEGIAEIKEVQNVIRQQLYNEKYSQKAAADIAEKIKGLDSLEAIAEVLKTTVTTGVDVRFSSLTGQGLDPKLIGAVTSAPEGKISAPLAGNIGTYVYKVNSRDTGAFYTEEDAKNAAAQKNSYMSQMIVPVMASDAEVKDNRARFY